jgi:hypothetical protein
MNIRTLLSIMATVVLAMIAVPAAYATDYDETDTATASNGGSVGSSGPDYFQFFDCRFHRHSTHTSFYGDTDCDASMPALYGHAWITFQGSTVADAPPSTCYSCSSLNGNGSSASYTFHTGWTYHFHFTTVSELNVNGSYRWTGWNATFCSVPEWYELDCAYDKAIIGP